ncbi:Acetyltransferase (GNAT) family protein [Rhizobiales bacterium GAS113]|nr:Acetyltransferase (GNAT) family protein [Rhizobiales bacterium GAS113]
MSSEPVTELRCAHPQDAGMIRDFVRAAYAKWVPAIGREPLPMTADYERAVQEHQIDILYIDGRMLGLIETMLRSDHLWIENIAVKPDSQGKGLGRQLLAHAERKAAEAGCAEIRLQTNAAFETNVALYERVGYLVDRWEPFMGGTTVYMSKKLSRA